MGTIVMWEALTFGLDRLAAAAADLGHDLVLLLGDRAPYRADLAANPDLRVVDVDTNDVDAVAAVIDGYDDLVGIVNNTDTWGIPAAVGIEARGLPGKSADFVRRLRDKAGVRQALVDAGLSRSQSVRLSRQQIVWGEFPADVAFPAVVKDVAGTASKGVHLVRSRRDLQALQAVVAESPVAEYVLETMFLGPMYSAEVLHWDGESRLLGICNRMVSPEPYVREESLAWPALAGTREPEVAAWISGLFEALKVEDGVYHAEFVMAADGPELVELNNRLGGTRVGEAIQSSGLDVHRALLQLALGQRPDVLDAERSPAGGFSQILVYAPRTGTVVEAAPAGDLSAFPGDVRWFPTRYPGDVIARIDDQSSCLGLVTAVGTDAFEAQDRALAAARTVVRDVR